jgi:uncharacterized membrane protein
MSLSTDHRLDRTVFFSDAVIAIAITLLIIEIHVPHVPGNDVNEGIAALVKLAPSFFGFVLSFLVIGRFWLGHSAALASMVSYDPRLFRANLYFLMMIALMPFATAFLSQNLGQIVPAVFYNAVLTLTAGANFLVMRIATDIKSGHSNLDGAGATLYRARSLIVLAAATLSVLLALVTPSFSQIPMALILFGNRFLPTRLKGPL